MNRLNPLQYRGSPLTAGAPWVNTWPSLNPLQYRGSPLTLSRKK